MHHFYLFIIIFPCIEFLGCSALPAREEPETEKMPISAQDESAPASRKCASRLTSRLISRLKISADQPAGFFG